MATQTLIRHFRLNRDGSTVFDVRVTYDDVTMLLTGVVAVNNSPFPLIATVRRGAQTRTFSLNPGNRSVTLPVSLRLPVVTIDGDIGVAELTTDVGVRYQ